MKFDVRRPLCAAFLAASLGALPIWAQANAPSSGTSPSTSATGGQTTNQQPGTTYQGSPGGAGQATNQPGMTHQGTPGGARQATKQPAQHQAGTQHNAPCTCRPGMAMAHGVVPSSITRTGELGEHLYNSAMANNWNAADKEVKALKRSTSKIRHQETATVQRLHTTVAALDTDVAKRHREATMRDANRITLIAAELSHRYNPAVPTDIARLDYYGRQLELESTTGNMAELRTTARQMRHTWREVRPEVESRGATTTARNFDQVVARIDSAKTPRAYRSAARSALDQTDNLERVFIRS